MEVASQVQVISPSHRSVVLASDKSSSPTKTPEELADIVAEHAASGGWVDRVRFRAEERWYERVFENAEYDIWIISWMPGQSTGFHDHGESAGAFLVATGLLEEHRPGEAPQVIPRNVPQAFDRDYAHDVRNNCIGPAVSIHAYSPPLREMKEYELDGTRLVPRKQASERAATIQQEPGVRATRDITSRSTQSIDQVLSAARLRLDRLTPDEAFQAASLAGAVLVDIRPSAQRATEGRIPRALIVERNVLEWRFDPTSAARLPIATNHDLQVIVFCSEGYTSSLAAAALQDLGLRRATDIIGGFKAWSKASLPTSIF